MVLIEQLNELWNTGRLLAVHPVTSPETPDNLIFSWLEAMELEYRRQLPESPPPLVPDYAVWAAKQFHRAAQLIVHRELGEAFIQSGLETQPQFIDRETSPHRLAAIYYSVDLHFRFLPDLVRIANMVSRTDPLLDQLKAWRDRWPLSGARIEPSQMTEAFTSRLEPILQNRCLRIMYIERRLSDPDVSEKEVAYWNQFLAQYEWKSVAKQ